MAPQPILTVRRTLSFSTAPSSATCRALRASRRRAVFFVAAAVLLAACATAATRRMMQAGGSADSPAVPPECMDAGLALQTKCSEEFGEGLSAFGVDPDALTSDPSAVQIDSAQLQSFLSKAPPPSVTCCEATAKFNNQYCSCAPAVLDLVLSFTNDDINQYRMLSKYFESGCKKIGKPYTLYLESTCPAKK